MKEGGFRIERTEVPAYSQSHRLETEAQDKTRKVERGVEGVYFLVQNLYELGKYYKSKGKLQRAVLRLRNAISICEVNGLEITDLFALIFNCLGHCLDHMGRSGEAEDSYRVAIKTLFVVFGGEKNNFLHNIDLGLVHYRLGQAFQELGHLSEAETSYETALALLESRLGNNHESVALVLNDFGLLRAMQGQNESAKDLYERAYKIYVSNGTENRSGVAEILNNLGNVLDASSDHILAIKCYSAAISIYESVGDKKAGIDVLKNMGLTYEKMGEFCMAEDTFWEALGKYQNITSDLDLDILSNIAHSYISRRNYPEAIACLLYGVELRWIKAQRVEVGVADDLNALGCCYASMGMFDRAYRVGEVALTIITFLHGQFHLSVGTVLNNIGNFFYLSAKYDTAVEYFQKALYVLWGLSEGRAEIELKADVMNNIGLVYCYTKGYQDSIRILEKALRIYEGLYGPGDVKSADTVGNIGTVFNIYGHYGEAIEQFKKAEKIYSSAYGQNSVESADVLRELAVAFTMQGEYEDAVAALHKAWDIYRLRLGFDHDLTVQTLYDKAVVLYNSQRTFEASDVARSVQAIWETNGSSNLDTEYGKWIIEVARAKEVG